MRSASQQSLKEFYGVLEKTARFGKVLNYESLQDGLSEDDYFVVMIELSILRGDILNVLTDKQNKDFKEKLGCYIEERLTITKNTFLIARYNQTLWKLCKNTNYAEKSIQGYRDLVKTYMVETLDPHLESTIGKIWNIILQLSYNIKSSQQSEIEQEMLGAIKDSNNSYRLKYWLIYYIQQNYKSCKSMQLAFIPEVCIDMLEDIDDYNWIKNFLKAGLFFAERLNKTLLPLFYEKLGDNEEKNIKDPDAEPNNILVPHVNHSIFQKMLYYYDLAKNKDKYNNTSKKYIDNKNKLQYIFIKEEMKITPEVKNYIIEFVNKTKESKLEDALFLLSIHNDLFFISLEIMNDIFKSEEKKDYIHTKTLTPIQMDINNNAHQTADKDNKEYEVFINYYMNSFKIIVNIIMSLIQQKKLTYIKIRKVLIGQTNFGEKITVNRGNVEATYCWFDKIDKSIEDFIKQFDNILKKKPVDWRTSLTMMTIQFESILRDYINLYGNGSIKQHGGRKMKSEKCY